jgi:enamine deaminase RidA (YjgF/YER057c/UK114 family)
MPTKYSGEGKSSSDAVVHDGVVYLRALVSETDSASAGEQAADIFRQIEKLLDEAGTSKRKMLNATIYCSDSRLFEEVNARWDAWVPWHDPPARTLVVARLATSAKRVSIQITAAL